MTARRRGRVRVALVFVCGIACGRWFAGSGAEDDRAADWETAQKAWHATAKAVGRVSDGALSSRGRRERSRRGHVVVSRGVEVGTDADLSRVFAEGEIIPAKVGLLVDPIGRRYIRPEDSM